ncbi:tetratricopeptide repeat protein [Mucilaginibacter robiniae]|uniref:Tetratricopeptide repeat protein n=2 Tax=Mucilaginibacter robiniae TaxID=2728022 RepID=A0A7L5E8W8_9SPHI|nr:tetratricopeptide repeat protein [Mucilaginibacter robiniae]
MVLPLLSLAANPATEAAFAKGNSAYAKKHYNEAISFYKQIVDEGYQSVAVYYNLGNAYYRNGDIAWAMLYYEKAYKLSPGDEAIKVNLQFARQKTADKLDPEPEFFITRWWHAFILAFSLHALAVLSIVYVLLGFALLSYYLFAGTVLLKKASFYSGLVLIGLGFISIFIANRQLHYFNHHHEAIIFGGAVAVKSTPATAAKSLLVLHDGTKVGVLNNQNGWMKIKLPNGNEGWVAYNNVKQI